MIQNLPSASNLHAIVESIIYGSWAVKAIWSIWRCVKAMTCKEERVDSVGQSRSHHMRQGGQVRLKVGLPVGTVDGLVARRSDMGPLRDWGQQETKLVE